MPDATTRTIRTAAVALLATTALLAALGTTPAGATRSGTPEATPAPRADYQFEGTLASSVPGAPNLRNINANGANFFVGDGPPTFGALRFPQGNGLRLDNASTVIPRGNYTISLSGFFFDQVVEYARVVNFKPGTSANADTGLYVTDGDLTFYDETSTDNDVLSPSTNATVVLTRAAATNKVKGYVNGELQFSFVDSTGLAKIGSTDVLRFFQDNGNDEESAGSVGRIRLWNTPLTGAQVAGLTG